MDIREQTHYILKAVKTYFTQAIEIQQALLEDIDYLERELNQNTIP